VIPADPLRLNPDSLLHYGQLTSNRQSDGGTGFYRFLVLDAVEAERCQTASRLALSFLGPYPFSRLVIYLDPLRSNNQH
jgi:hypothetical protein